MKKIVENIFFGNYFYGLCAVALSIEATLQQQISFNHILFYIIIFTSTVYYYSKAYVHVNDPNSRNPRISWYYHHKNKIVLSQKILFYITTISTILYLLIIAHSNSSVFNYSILSPTFFFFLLLFPLTGLLYYGLTSQGLGKYNLRNVGWLKPIIIGFTWAGLVTTYPVIFSNLENARPIKFELVNVLLFIKNMMFVLVLSIMFDFKDYAADYNKKIKTFVVKFGLRKTIFFILLPLCVIGLGTFIIFGISRNFSFYKIFFNTIPFICLLFTAYSMKNRRSILYYLIIIDGLMLLKAVCGSIGMFYF